MWWLRIGRDISAAEVPTEDGAIPVPHWAPQPGAPVKARGVLATAGCKNQQGLSLGGTPLKHSAQVNRETSPLGPARTPTT